MAVGFDSGFFDDDDDDDDFFPTGGFADILSNVEEMERTMPRFLFRGFCGAGNGLNSLQGVYPFALRPDLAPRGVDGSMLNNGVPTLSTNVRDISYEQLRAYAHRHFSGETNILSPFTSWAANWSTALYFALGRYANPWRFSDAGEEGFICILDVHAFLQQGERGRRIFHADNIGSLKKLPMEYLIYGAVEGEACFKCVPFSQLRAASGCQNFPFCTLPARVPHQVTQQEVSAALAVGRLFQPAQGGRLDRALAVMAGVLSWQQMGIGSPRPLTTEEIVRAGWGAPAIVVLPGGSLDVIERCLLMRPPLVGSGSVSVAPRGLLPPVSMFPLVNLSVVTTNAPDLQLASSILQALQATWYNAASEGVPIAPSVQAWDAVWIVSGNSGTGSHICPS